MSECICEEGQYGLTRHCTYHYPITRTPHDPDLEAFFKRNSGGLITVTLVTDEMRSAP